MFGWTRIATLAAVAATLALATGVAGATSQPGSVSGAGSHLTRAGKITGSAAARAELLKAAHLRTRAGAARYLRSIGIKPNHLVIQRGIRNYAGANCPGAGWSCTSTAHPVIQIAAAGGSNTFQCATASCAVVQATTAAPASPKPATNKATCIKTTGPTQSCAISQASATANNVAIVIETNNLSGLTQTALSTAQITQRATGASNANTACVLQNISVNGSTTAKKGAAVNVTLNAHQSVSISQDSVAGSNTIQAARLSDDCGAAGSALTQSQTLASGATGSGSITQNENNVDSNPASCLDSGPNVCLDIAQNSTSGVNTSAFTQTNTLTAIASTTPTGPVSQTQSSPNGGLLATVNQFSHGVSTSVATQTETQCEHAQTSGVVNTANCVTTAPQVNPLSQVQYGPLRKGAGPSTQGDNSGDTFAITQSSTQKNDTGSNQTNTVQADCSTSGNCTVSQSVDVNGNQTGDTQSGQNVSSSINCSGSSCTATPPPTPTITDHPSNPSDSSSASFSFTDTDPTVTFECQIDNSGYSTGCTSPWTYDNLADGSHTFYVKAKNGTGQVSDPATFTWTIAGGNASASSVRKLNPATDPAGGMCSDSFASGTGFDGAPQEVSETAGLSQFDGQAIQLRFSFSTGDALYNAFEGWYVKNIQVTGTQSGSPVTVFSDAVADGDTSFTASSDFGITPGWHVTDRRNSTFGGPAWWYGNEATGTYQSPNPIDGCTDSSANAGTITSPVFTLATNSQLSFDTLWQIEGVNSSTFDLMDVQVIPVTSGPPIG
jgi:hypothetical protein